MILLRLLGIGAVYGVGFMFVKSLFPEPFVLLILQGGQSSEGDLTTLALVYMGVGLLAGLIAGPIFGGALILRRGRSEGSGPRFVLSLALALLTGLISGLLTLIVYAAGILPGGGVLDHRPRPSASRPRRSLPLPPGWRRAPTALRRRKTTGTETLLLGGIASKHAQASRPSLVSTSARHPAGGFQQDSQGLYTRKLTS